MVAKNGRVCSHSVLMVADRCCCWQKGVKVVSFNSDRGMRYPHVCGWEHSNELKIIKSAHRKWLKKCKDIFAHPSLEVDKSAIVRTAA